MIWFFQRQDDHLHYEVRRQRNGGGYELVVGYPDGSEDIERFENPRDLNSRWLDLNHALRDQGWRIKRQPGVGAGTEMLVGEAVRTRRAALCSKALSGGGSGREDRGAQTGDRLPDPLSWLRTLRDILARDPQWRQLDIAARAGRLRLAALRQIAEWNRKMPSWSSSYWNSMIESIEGDQDKSTQNASGATDRPSGPRSKPAV